MKQLAIVSLTFALAIGPALTGRSAHAEEKQAEALFKKGKKLLAEKRYADACAAFEKSNSLDPNIGAKLNVAKCFEEWGKLATALRWYRDAEKTARDTKDPRADKIHERVEEVDSDTPRLTLRTAKDADTSVKVTLDGAPARLDEAFEVDPGAHVVEYIAANGDKKKKVIPVERGGSSEVKLDLPKLKPGQKPLPPPPPTAGEPVPTPVEPEPEDPGRTRRLIGIVAGSAGIAAIGVASYLTLDARGSYKDALAAHCAGSTSMCNPMGLQITHDARSQANLATVVGLIGVAAVAGGVVLYLTAPKAGTLEAKEDEGQAWYLAPSIAGDGGGLVFGGRY